jgi:hypothetical protein
MVFITLGDVSCRTGPLRVGRSLRDLCTFLVSVGDHAGLEFDEFGLSDATGA